MSVPFVFCDVAPTNLSTVAGPYGTVMPGGVVPDLGGGASVKMPSELTLPTPTAAPKSPGSSAVDHGPDGGSADGSGGGDLAVGELGREDRR